jgi:hypothetical protein
MSVFESNRIPGPTAFRMRSLHQLRLSRLSHHRHPSTAAETPTAPTKVGITERSGIIAGLGHVGAELVDHQPDAGHRQSRYPLTGLRVGRVVRVRPQQAVDELCRQFDYAQSIPWSFGSGDCCKSAPLARGCRSNDPGLGAVSVRARATLGSRSRPVAGDSASGQLVAVELGEVVSAHHQPPLGPHG